MILLTLARKVTDTFKKFALARLQCEAREYMMNTVDRFREDGANATCKKPLSQPVLVKHGTVSYF